jgi:protocatechuate 3,4-dioxygenase beta subunit
MDSDVHDHDRGLAFDVSTLVERRRALKLMAGAGLAALVGCGSSSKSPTVASSPSSSSATSSTSSATSTTAAGSSAPATNVAQIPEETAGPYPGDGSNGPNVLTESGIVRSDIRPSFGSSSGTAEGVPLRIELTVTDVAGAAMPGAAVYLWHCDRDGSYSLYDIEDQNYLRGVQETDSTGALAFTSIFPGAYSGRWPHMHFEVYPDLASATSSDNAIATSQLALPQAMCEQVYATDGYSRSVRNLAGSSLDSDNVFRDGYESQLAAVTGDITSGLVAALTVPVQA